MAAIYQRARPVTFSQLIGQEHVTSVLRAALTQDRLTHAYLFSGPRGVGKTTTARLLAMAVNCEQPDPAARPCGECESCRLVRSGSHPDVIELDAASNNSVDDVRDLREKVRLASLRGGMRVWVLDEAHMLSKAAANALLKTLEEPPENLIFILATTEPEKLPPTILSRTQHFRFRRLAESEISGKLAGLCKQADVEAEPEALSLVARAADGAMRDAESLLERLLTGGAITRQAAEEDLGLPPQERVQTLARSLAEGDLEKLFTEAGNLYQDGFSPRSLAERLLFTLRQALYAELGMEEGFKLGLSEADLLRLIGALDDELERFTRHDDLFSLEVALIKAGNTLARTPPNDLSSVSEEAVAPTTADTAPKPVASPARAPPATPKAEPVPSAEKSPAAKVNWRDVQKEASPQLKAFMMPAQHEIEGQDIYLRFSELHTFHFQQLKGRQDELHILTTKVLGEGYTVHLIGPGETVRKKA